MDKAEVAALGRLVGWLGAFVAPSRDSTAMEALDDPLSPAPSLTLRREPSATELATCSSLHATSSPDPWVRVLPGVGPALACAITFNYDMRGSGSQQQRARDMLLDSRKQQLGLAGEPWPAASLMVAFSSRWANASNRAKRSCSSNRDWKEAGRQEKQTAAIGLLHRPVAMHNTVAQSGNDFGRRPAAGEYHGCRCRQTTMIQRCRCACTE